MLAKSYVAEGYGPNAVIMCAPLPGVATLQFVAGSGAPEGALVNDAPRGMASTPTTMPASSLARIPSR